MGVAFVSNALGSDDGVKAMVSSAELAAAEDAGEAAWLEGVEAAPPPQALRTRNARGRPRRRFGMATYPSPGPRRPLSGSSSRHEWSRATRDAPGGCARPG